MKPEDILFWVMFVVAIAVVIWYFFGESPTLEQALLILTLTLVIKGGFGIQRVISDLTYLKSDAAQLKAEVADLKGRIQTIEQKNKR
jgi:hypothetical protein